MENKLEKIKSFIVIAVAGFSSFFGATAKEFAVLFMLIGIDTVFGWIKSIKNKEFKSNTARIGFMGKIVELMLVGCAKLLDWLFGTNFLEYTSLYYFMICEVSSILENYSQINGNLPEGLIELLNSLKDNVASKIVRIVYDFINGKGGK